MAEFSSIGIGAQLAVEAVNKDGNILSSHEIELIVDGSDGSDAVASYLRLQSDKAKPIIGKKVQIKYNFFVFFYFFIYKSTLRFANFKTVSHEAICMQPGPNSIKLLSRKAYCWKNFYAEQKLSVAQRTTNVNLM